MTTQILSPALDWDLSRVQEAAGSPAWVRHMLLLTTFLLVAFGLISVYSASAFSVRQSGLPSNYVLMSQLARAGAGVVALMAGAFVDYRLYQRLAWPILFGSAALLIVVILPFTTEIAPPRNGARRWLTIGPLTFQPSEIAKIAVVCWTAYLAVRKQNSLGQFKRGLLPFVVVLGPLLLLIAAEPHMSAMLITTAVIACVLFGAGARLQHFGLILLSFIPVVVWMILTKGYQLERILAFLRPGDVTSGSGYQLEQARIAIGAGGVLGAGFGRSTQKLSYLPEAQNDFIFAIIAEEWGFVGAATIVILFLLWSLLGLRIARAAPDLFGRLLAQGLTCIVAIAAFGHIGITMGLLPTTGVGLPFISAGGTGLVTALGIVGILINIARRRRA